MSNIFKRKYGFNIFNQQLEEQFVYASKHGLHHVEINLSEKHFAIDSFNNARIKKLGELSRKHKVKLSSHIPYFINISEMCF